MSNRIPKYLRQREKNRPVDRAYTYVKGKKFGLGPYGSPQSLAKYQAILDACPRTEATEPQPPREMTASELMAAYLVHANKYYRKPDGTVGSEYAVIVNACRYVKRKAGSTLVTDFGPKRLKEVRQEMIKAGLSRKNINKQIGRIVRMFRWGAEEELLHSDIPQTLSMVTGLRKGRSEAKESKRVRPVDAETIKATITKLPQVVGDMVEIQLLTGMRPGELVIMRPCDIDRERPVWIYTPAHHKTEYRDHPRTIAIGPRAQSVLLRYLARAHDAFLFQPRDSEAKRRAELSAARKTSLSCGNRPGTNRRDNPKKQPGNRYTVDSYRRAIARAAKHANVEQWSPHRLRHTAATTIRKVFGLDACQAVLGHQSARITEVYAELDLEKSAEVALRIG